MAILENDLASYDIEQIEIRGSMDWVYEYHKELEGKFMDIYENKIPKFDELLDEQLAQYVDGPGNWVQTNDTLAARRDQTTLSNIIAEVMPRRDRSRSYTLQGPCSCADRMDYLVVKT
ncbi:hypothetical protein B0F90DRAFT_1180313 [Multifurca ochricompacta]|uniref:Uncharacterized protein n=1 Tax=Multifurca ochricompacta TaxID=376703 RepID=A0AAD4M7N0_9AGAM|nr:hypothetical protein B0F90DRAFT_1180313 [Multifurca ochricompacta]